MTAEEILQEVFMRLWSESPSLSQEGGSVVAWLVVTAREAAVNRLRASRKNAPNAAPQAHNANAGKGSDSGTRKSKAATLAALRGKIPRTKKRSDETASCEWARQLPVTRALPRPGCPSRRKSR